jgi:putative transcriptional regulator
MKTTRKKIIDTVGLLTIVALLVWFPFKLQQPGIADQKILVAAEKLQDGVFDKTVILILDHDGLGAFGLVLNKPPPQKDDPDWGGPLGKNTYFTLHSLDVSGKGTVRIPDLQVGYTKGEDFAKSLGGERGKPEDHIIFKGYAGWGRGQLPREIARGAWKLIDFNRDLVFHTSPKKMWETAIRMPVAEK